MSLIQDALRRKQDPDRPVASPEPESPLPPAPVEPPGRKGRKPDWPSALTVVFIVVVLVGALLGLTSLFRSCGHEKPAAETAASPAAMPVEPQVDPQPQAKGSTSPPVERAAVPTADVKLPREFAELKVMGVFARPEQSDSSALINGTMLDVGQNVAGGRLVEVRENGVVLEYQGQRQFVRVGQSPEN